MADDMTAACPACGASIAFESGTEEGEILVCEECSTELEVTSIDPPELEPAPEEEEDWGE